VNRQISRVAILVFVLFGALFVNLNVISLVIADDLANHPANRRLILREYSIERGLIVAGEDAIARSVETDGQFRFQRVYPEGPLYAHLTGYYSLVLQRSGLEAALNEDLTGRSTEVVAQNLGELLAGRERPGNTVRLTVRPQIQEAARSALGDNVGAVVAIDPTSGAVLASFANPTFDPNPLSSLVPREINEAFAELNQPDAGEPLLDRTRQGTYPPGSTFKLITAAAALERGLQPETAFPDEGTFDVPQTSADIGNFGGGLCADGEQISLEDAMAVSCNTVFARLGVDLGTDALVDMAERFGFNARPPFELDVAPSVVPRDMDVPATAQSAIGQRDVRATPMQMALLAATIANGGQLPRPHIVEAVEDPNGELLRGPDSGRWTDPAGDGVPISPRTAAQLRDMLVLAVEDGTGGRAAIDGVTVGGKTGTAQTGGDPLAWFIGFADEDVAVAVVVIDAGSDATGGAVAAPIARAVMEAALASRS
jgi:peptidoglycan glycosyltransferase